MSLHSWTLAPAGFLLILVGCTSMFPLSGAHESSTPAGDLVARLTNKDVSWDGTYIGLQPVLAQNAQRVVTMGTNAVPFLMRSLTNCDQYVVAHVLLTKISLPSFQSDSSHWNLLPVQLLPDGRVSYGENAQTVVRDYWLSHKPVQ